MRKPGDVKHTSPPSSRHTVSFQSDVGVHASPSAPLLSAVSGLIWHVASPDVTLKKAAPYRSAPIVSGPVVQPLKP